MPDIICQYGNCTDTETPILLTLNHRDPKVRVRFCSLAHLIAWAEEKRQRGWEPVNAPSNLPNSV